MHRSLVGLVAGILLFAATAILVRSGETQSVDRSLLLAMRHPGDLSPRGSLPLQEAARDTTSLGGAVVLGIVTLATAGFLALDRKRHMAYFALASVVSGVLLSLLLKGLFERPRPTIVPHSVYAASTSFPSGHSMISAVTYLTLGALIAQSHRRRALKAYFIGLAALLSVAVGITRVYLGVHWPSDVFAGWVAGSTWALLCSTIARMLQSRHALEPEPTVE